MRKVIPLAAAGLLLASTGAAQAYIGPGAGLSAVGTVVALLGALALALLGFVWYPVKRLRARRRAKSAGNEGGPA